MQIHPNDRGFFTELARLGSDGIASQMVPTDFKRIQISGTSSYPGLLGLSIITILIPPGAGHGHKVLGTQPARLVYIADRYDPKDERRLSYDYPNIGYDWKLGTNRGNKCVS